MNLASSDRFIMSIIFLHELPFDKWMCLNILSRFALSSEALMSSFKCAYCIRISSANVV